MLRQDSEKRKELIPYFKSLDAQKRPCPKCFQPTLYIEPTLNPKIAVENCTNCDFTRTLNAPQEALQNVGRHSAKRSNIIKVNFGNG